MMPFLDRREDCERVPCRQGREREGSGWASGGEDRRSSTRTSFHPRKGVHNGRQVREKEGETIEKKPISLFRAGKKTEHRPP